MRINPPAKSLFLRCGAVAALLAIVVYLWGDFAHRVGHVHDHDCEHGTEQCLFEKIGSILSPPVLPPQVEAAQVFITYNPVTTVWFPLSEGKLVRDRGPPLTMPANPSLA